MGRRETAETPWRQDARKPPKAYMTIRRRLRPAVPRPGFYMASRGDRCFGRGKQFRQLDNAGRPMPALSIIPPDTASGPGMPLADADNTASTSGYLLASFRARRILARRMRDSGETNANWDGVWCVQTRIVDDGWTAEIAIPFKTLKFPRSPVQTWGVNFQRNLRRRNEDSDFFLTYMISR